MFEHLKAGSGTRTKERTRLWVTVAACLVLGTAIWGGKSGCAGGETEHATPVAVDEAAARKGAPEPEELDRTPLLALAEGTGSLQDFDPAALDYVVSEVGKDTLSHKPWKVLRPAEVAAADPKDVVGRMIETRGVVRSLDREEHDLPHVAKGSGRLWAFALDGDDGSSIVVVHPGSSQDLEEKPPRARMRLPGSGSDTRLKDGDLVQVRGIYLQRRVGTIARVTLGAPTPVLVGREYRFTEEPNPPLESPSQASFEKIQDRFLGEMRSPESVPAKQLVQWAQTLGHDEIVRRIENGQIPVSAWSRDEFVKWRTEMAAEKASSAPDGRTWAPAQRGKAFWTQGILQDFLQEDWDRLPPNAYGVDRRWKLYMLSDHHGYLPLVFDSPFPVTAFKGVTGHAKQRVRAYGIYVQAHTFEIGNSQSARRGSVESPFFVLLDLRPVHFPTGTPVLQNPFFWTWVSLAVFGVVFFLVMSRIERKERTAIEAQRLRIRRRQRELGQSVGAPPRKGPKTDAGANDPSPPAGEGGPGSPPP